MACLSVFNEDFRNKPFHSVLWLLKLLLGATFCTAAVGFTYAVGPSTLIGIIQSISFLALWWKS